MFFYYPSEETGQHERIDTMGNLLSRPPEPVDVYLVHLHPQQRPIDGYVQGNAHTLKYTLPSDHSTVAQLLAMTHQHSTPKGNGVVGFTRMKYDWDTRTTQPTMLALDEPVVDGETLYLVVL